ncbi:unnamed protein product [Paramecium sonneborni]|uniref:Peptidase C19 ubiquitin carboxyl-terminal hydrolase domain-containing protein n=1 Tax=Paramecium sonneborni TaxID=65129 RepID=A0A8S1M0R1_9CILI|nr:unnamed protein product [Paramecium sonneborni]
MVQYRIPHTTKTFCKLLDYIKKQMIKLITVNKIQQFQNLTSIILLLFKQFIQIKIAHTLINKLTITINFLNILNTKIIKQVREQLNVIIQMLYSIKQFRKYILDLPFKQLKTDSIIFCLQKLFQVLRFSKQITLNPFQFYHAFCRNIKQLFLKMKNIQFQVGRQEDAHEFLFCSFQTLVHECKSQSSKNNFLTILKTFLKTFFQEMIQFQN